jgi:pyruvate,water dikinase
MRFFWQAPDRTAAAGHPLEGLSQKYQHCREVIAHNNEALELLAAVQEDLLYAPPRADVVGSRVASVFGEVSATIGALECLTDRPEPALREAIERQRREVELFLAARQERPAARLAVRLSDIGRDDAREVGAKAAMLAEVRNRLDIPVPDGYVMTTEAYEQFWVVPQWRRVRDEVRGLDAADPDRLSRVSHRLRAALLGLPLPRAVEVALTDRALVLDLADMGLSVRSSAVGEGESRTFAGQFRSSINVPLSGLATAYRAVIASRFSRRALAYRLSLGLPDVDSPMAVLVLPTLAARAAGVLYTQNPEGRHRDELWITARWGLGIDVAHGHQADLFVVSRRRSHDVIERQVVSKPDEVVPRCGGGLLRRRVSAERVDAPALGAGQLARLAEWGLRIEDHFGAPQDIEWLLDESNRLWIVQTRPLARAPTLSGRSRPAFRSKVLFSAGRAVFPGRASGPAFLARSPGDLRQTPQGAIVFLRRASPEIVRIFPRIAGLVAEGGNVTGHAATLLREFQIPSLFEARGVFEQVCDGEVISLDSGARRIYLGTPWATPGDRPRPAPAGRGRSREDVVGRRLLALTLVDPTSWGFRPSKCQSAHDVLRFCHERAIGEMFALNDRELRHGTHQERRLVSDAPINLQVLDLGGGLCLQDQDAHDVRPAQIASRPFQALYRGLTHPAVTWNRDMPASLGGLASVMGQAFAASQPSTRRPVGAKSYLMVSRDYMNLNARLAFHFTLVDAILSEVPGENAIAFRFAGGGASRQRRDLRACFIEACLSHYGFVVDRRGDLVNAWFKKATAADTEARLDILGRLMACSSQLDMYMADVGVMQWYVGQFLAGNYGFRTDAASAEGAPSSNGAGS